jgi:hypothetical protein
MGVSSSAVVSTSFSSSTAVSFSGVSGGSGGLGVSSTVSLTGSPGFFASASPENYFPPGLLSHPTFLTYHPFRSLATPAGYTINQNKKKCNGKMNALFFLCQGVEKYVHFDVYSSQERRKKNY